VPEKGRNQSETGKALGEKITWPGELGDATRRGVVY